MAKLIISEVNTLEGELQALAIENWPEFARIIGEEALAIAKICHLKKKGKSIRQIANRLKMPKSTVHYNCSKCSQGNLVLESIEGKESIVLSTTNSF